jgi:hypothetical protein
VVGRFSAATCSQKTSHNYGTIEDFLDLRKIKPRSEQMRLAEVAVAEVAEIEGHSD